MADPDLELRGGGGGVGLDLLAMVAIFPSVISSFFFTQNKGAPRAPPLDPPLGSGAAQLNIFSEEGGLYFSLMCTIT